MTAGYKKIGYLIFVIYMTITLVLPLLQINKVIWMLMMVMLFCKVIANRGWKVVSFSPLIMISIFAYGFFSAFFQMNCNRRLSIQFFLASFGLLIYYYVKEYEIDYDKAIKTVGSVLVIVDILYTFLASYKYKLYMPFGLMAIRDSIVSVVPNWFTVLVEKYGETSAGVRGFFPGINFMAHLGTVPFLYLPMCLWYKELITKKRIINVIWILAGFLAILALVSRAMMLLTVASLMIITVINCKTSYKKYLFVICIIFMAISGLLWLYLNTDYFSTREVSNSIKMGHISSFWEALSSKQLLWGNGLGAYYYSSGVGKYIAHTEITLLDYIRYFGMPIAMYIYILVVVPDIGNLGTISLSDVTEKLDSYIIIGGYLLMSLTNPVLFNSMGILIIIWHWNNVGQFRLKGKSDDEGMGCNCNV